MRGTGRRLLALGVNRADRCHYRHTYVNLFYRLTLPPRQKGDPLRRVRSLATAGVYQSLPNLGGCSRTTPPIDRGPEGVWSVVRLDNVDRVYGLSTICLRYCLRYSLQVRGYIGVF